MRFRNVGIGVMVLVGVSFLVGCSPGLGTSLPIGTIPTPAPRGGGTEDVPVRVHTFIDGRAARVVTVGDRTVRAEGDVPGKVQVALADFLKANGFRLSAGEAAGVRGTVLEWAAVVTPGFPTSEVSSTASFELEAFGPDSPDRYVRRYSGSAVTRHPFLNEGKVRETMGDAMGYALQAAMEDTRLLEHLRKSVPQMVPWQ